MSKKLDQEKHKLNENITELDKIKANNNNLKKMITSIIKTGDKR